MEIKEDNSIKLTFLTLEDKKGNVLEDEIDGHIFLREGDIIDRTNPGEERSKEYTIKKVKLFVNDYEYPDSSAILALNYFAKEE